MCEFLCFENVNALSFSLSLSPHPFLLQFFVSDNEGQRSFSIEVEIVSATDDQPPSFSQDSYTYSIREDEKDGTEIGDLEVSDTGEG